MTSSYIPKPVNQGLLKPSNGASKFEHIANFSKFWQQAQLRGQEFDWQFYLDYYDDIQLLSSEQKAFEHWILFGRVEGRVPNQTALLEKLEKNRADLPTDFDAEGYWVLNLDLRDKFSSSRYQKLKATEHFLEYGRYEGRAYKSDFDWKFYIKFNQLDQLSSYIEAYDHWLTIGCTEDRFISEKEMIYSFDQRVSELPQDFCSKTYLKLNPDLQKRFHKHQYEAYKTIEHFLYFGRYEGRPYTLNTQTIDQVGFSQLRKLDIEAQTVDVRLIAFYLPQFHPIPENDQWWGKGFTEWTNVAQAKPLFEGHYQPHIPADLGFYDLRLPEARIAQAELAKKYGIHGFCYYYYWFAGKRLLNRPLDDVLASQTPDFPFCICWANENWTRRWDGQAHEILIAQEFSDEQNQAFAESIVPILQDRRYIRIDGKPLLLIYRADIFPNALHTTNQWREIFRNHNVGEVHLAVALTCFSGLLSGLTDPTQLGFDSAVQFAPHEIPAPETTPDEPTTPEFSGKFYDYKTTAVNAVATKNPKAKVFLSAMPSWDNTARRKTAAHAFLNSNPQDYEFWLRGAIEKTRQRYSGDERIVFVNAWNEWAEGAHLEPDQKYGHSFLVATHQALHGTDHWSILIKLLQYLPLERQTHLDELLDQLEQCLRAMNQSLRVIQQLLSQKLAQVVEVVRIETDSDLLWNLDSLESKQSVHLSSIELRGWAMGVHMPISALEVRYHNYQIAQVPIHLNRPDVANHFSNSHSEYSAQGCGFYDQIDITGKIAKTSSLVELHLDVVMQDGQIIPIGIIRLTVTQASRYAIQSSEEDQLLIAQIRDLGIATTEKRYSLLNRLERELMRKEKDLEVGQLILKNYPASSFFEQF